MQPPSFHGLMIIHGTSMSTSLDGWIMFNDTCTYCPIDGLQRVYDALHIVSKFKQCQICRLPEPYRPSMVHFNLSIPAPIYPYSPSMVHRVKFVYLLYICLQVKKQYVDGVGFKDMFVAIEQSVQLFSTHFFGDLPCGRRFTLENDNYCHSTPHLAQKIIIQWCLFLKQENTSEYCSWQKSQI